MHPSRNTSSATASSRRSDRRTCGSHAERAMAGSWRTGTTGTRQPCACISRATLAAQATAEGTCAGGQRAGSFRHPARALWTNGTVARPAAQRIASASSPTRWQDTGAGWPRHASPRPCRKASGVSRPRTRMRTPDGRGKQWVRACNTASSHSRPRATSAPSQSSTMRSAPPAPAMRSPRESARARRPRAAVPAAAARARSSQ